MLDVICVVINFERKFQLNISFKINSSLRIYFLNWLFVCLKLLLGLEDKQKVIKVMVKLKSYTFSIILLLIVIVIFH